MNLRTQRGSAASELVAAMPLILMTVAALLALFNINLARQRTFGALPEVGRRLKQDGTRVKAFSPTPDATCKIGELKVTKKSSLNKVEEELCRDAGYIPPRELRQSGYTASTVCESRLWPGLLEKVEIRTPYSATYLVPKGGSQ